MTHVRPMREDDIDALVDVGARAFEMPVHDAPDRARWMERLGHALRTDPEGCFAAVEGEDVVGVAQAIRRERLWNLTWLTVDPDAQSAGVGHALMRAAAGYRRPEDSGLIVASNDPRAIRIYGLGGFAIHPTLEAVGEVRRLEVPALSERIREVSAGELETLESVTRHVRGAPYTSELPIALSSGAQIFALEDRGYVLVRPEGGIWGLGARDEEAATALLWHGLRVAGACGGPPVRWITSEQQWAVRVVLAAGLRLQSHGALCVLGRPGTLAPYLPSGAYA